MNGGCLILSYIKILQPVGEFYACVVPAQTLLSICKFDFRKIEENNGVKEFLGIQRPLNDNRVRDIRKYIRTEDASFPTSVVLAIDERCAHIDIVDDGPRIVLRPYSDPENGAELVPFTAIATIIDGQHRLKAFEGTNVDWDLSVNLLIGADQGTQAMIFSKVNLAQTKVNKSLVYDLFSLDRNRSPEKTAHEIVVNLNVMPESPFYYRIKRLGTSTEGVFGETLSQATIVKGLLPLISTDPLVDRDIGRRRGIWPEKGQDDFEKRIFYPAFRENRDGEILANLLNYFNAVKERWPIAWERTGRGSVLPKTNGFNALIRFLRDVYLHITTSPRLVSQEEYYKLLQLSELSDDDFSVENFKPGSSGSAELYRSLKKILPI